MVLDHVVGDGESQPGSLADFLRGEEEVEDLGGILRTKADAVVLQQELQLAVLDEQADVFEIGGVTLVTSRSRLSSDTAIGLLFVAPRTMERYIDAALRLSNGNLSEAARLLGVNRTTLYSKIQRLKVPGDSDGDTNV